MLPHHAKYYDGHFRELNQSSGPHRGFNQSSGPCRGFGQVAYKHHAKYSNGRIQELKQYSGPHRGFGRDAYDSESDSESDGRGPHPPTIASGNNQQCHASCSNQQHLPKLLQNDQKTSTACRFTHVSQATQREDTQALRGSRPSGPPRESSGARSGPPSPWGPRETKKRIIDALKNELSDIHLFTGDETRTTTTGRGINYARIHELYAPKHNMNNFCQNFKR